MERQNLNKVKEGDYILLITKSKITFAGTIEKIEEKNGEQLLVFQPSKDSPLWIMVKRSFIEKIKVLVPSEEGVK